MTGPAYASLHSLKSAHDIKRLLLTCCKQGKIWRNQSQGVTADFGAQPFLTPKPYQVIIHQDRLSMKASPFLKG